MVDSFSSLGNDEIPLVAEYPSTGGEIIVTEGDKASASDWKERMGMRINYLLFSARTSGQLEREQDV